MRVGLYSLLIVAASVFGVADCNAQPAKWLTCRGELRIGSLDSAVGDCGFITKSSMDDAIRTVCVPGRPCVIEAEVEGTFIARLFAVKIDVPSEGDFDWRKAPNFRTPSNQIHCMFVGDEKKSEPSGIACDINQSSVRIPIRPRPKDCDFDWGQRFELGADNDASLECSSDWVGSEDSPSLTYGNSVKTGKIVCTSEETGLTCRNENGHGFFLSRRSQKIF